MRKRSEVQSEMKSDVVETTAELTNGSFTSGYLHTQALEGSEMSLKNLVRMHPDISDAVDEVTVTWGEETYCPVPFHAFKVGPFTMKTTVHPGETRKQAFARAYDELEEQARAVVMQKAREFLSSIDNIKKR